MSRRDQIRMTDDEVQSFLQERQVMNVASLRKDGRPHLVAMWYGFLDGKPAFWTYGRSQKIVNLRRDPRITCLVEDGDAYEELRGVELVGTATLIEDERRFEIGRSVMERYTGPLTGDVDPILQSVGAKRAGVVIEVEAVVSWDHRKLGGVY